MQNIMKCHTKLFTILIFLTNICLFADTVTINGYIQDGNATRNNITGTSVSTDLILNSTVNEAEKSGPMYRAINIVVHSITAIDSNAEDGKGGVNIASNTSTNAITIDINSTEDATAIDAAYWKQNFITTNIQNSASNTAEITVNFGNELVIDSSSTDQKQTINFKNITAIVNATKTTVSNSSMYGTIYVDKNSDVTWNGNISMGKVGSTRNGLLSIDGTFRMGGNITTFMGITLNLGETGAIYSTNKTLQIGTDSTANIYGSLYMNGGSYFNLYGTCNVYNTNPTAQLNMYSVNSNGTFNQATASQNNGLRIWRTANIYGDAKWTIDERLDLRGNIVSGVDASVTTSNLKMNDNAKIILTEVEGKTARVILWGLSNMYLTSENCFTDQNGNPVRIVSAVGEYPDYTSEIHILGNQKFKDIYATDDLKIFLDDNISTIILTNPEQTLTIGNGKVIDIYDFMDNRIYVGTSEKTLAQIDKVNAYNSMNELMEITVSSEGWLVAVPEPAEWAFVLGAMSLLILGIRRKLK